MRSGGEATPDLPRCVTLVELLQALLVLERIHALPETPGSMRQQGALVDQPLERRAHQLVAGLHIVEDLLAEHEEAAVDPDIGVAQGRNLSHFALGGKFDDVETRRRLYQEQG